MLFNSFIFIVFAILFFIGWQYFKHQIQGKWIYITIASFVFYGWWDWRFLFLIIFSGIIDFYAGLYIIKYPRLRKPLLLLSLFMNLGSLAIFKYSVFIVENLDALFNATGFSINLSAHIPSFALILPVGISFYTFQSMSYTIDIYKGKLMPVKNVFHFFAYLSMFPQLVAGPIIRAKDLLKQLSVYRPVSDLMFWNGLKLIVIGFFQKTVLADNIATLVNYSFNNVEKYNGFLFWWIVVIAFAFQIYFDFSGYSLIARGLAKWMGLHFKINFNHPYLANSLKDFWQRWHISLSTWFRDYVYIPLGGNKKGKLLSHLFMWITMVLSGIWHGPSWTYIIWGILHALFLSFERIITGIKKLKFVHYFLTMFLVLIAWVFFRAENITQAEQIIHKLFTMKLTTSLKFGLFFTSYIFLLIAVMFEFFYWLQSKNTIVRRTYKSTAFEVVELTVLTLAILFLRGPEQEFIYFQF
jgi:D-alanyl-lipoteichoic acid acyltransferase DltB (MBOAT superfamily)